MVHKNALALVGAGLALGVSLALAGERLAGSVVDTIATGRAGPIGLAAAGMLGVTLLAAHVPARRAAGVSPIEALRRE